MPHVVTQACCADASCVHACPVNCIHPTPDEPDFDTADMLYIDPDVCVDCGACVGACPVSAIVPHSRLEPGEQDFLGINAELAEPKRKAPPQARVPTLVRLSATRTTTRVAIVGAGPAALYAADELLKQDGIEVTVFDRLSVPHGLARFGVAPDHGRTRAVSELFRKIEGQAGFRYRLGVDVGGDISPVELAEHHSAVIYATGASTDRPLDIPGIELPGSTSTTEIVAWYNGHPDAAGARVHLDHERVVVVGNGNVALDVARMLATEPGALADADIDPDVRERLRRSQVREIHVLGRRGPAQAAFTLPELVGLAARTDIDLRVQSPEPIDPDAATDKQGRIKLRLLADIAAREPRPGLRKIVLRFFCAPKSVVGTSHVEGLEVEQTRLDTSGKGVISVPDSEEFIPAGLVLRSVGYRGVEVPGVPFDQATATIPHRRGRVFRGHGEDAVPGMYVVGWIKRGPNGFIGSNKSCARETVNSLLADLNAGALPAPRPAREFADLLQRRCGAGAITGAAV